MSNLERYNQIFRETFDVENTELEGLAYQNTSLWDSVGHMNLVAAVEETFDIMMDTDDIIDFSSYKKGVEILKKNYNVQFQ